jgi:hypothetical protein
VTCPNEITVSLSARRRASFGTHCATCPLRPRCTTAQRGGVIVMHEHHDLLIAARAQARTDQFDTDYRRRPLVERTLAWLVPAHRRLPYRGIDRNHLHWTHRCAAINLRRLVALGLTTNPTGNWTITAAT